MLFAMLSILCYSIYLLTTDWTRKLIYPIHSGFPTRISPQGDARAPSIVSNFSL